MSNQDWITASRRQHCPICDHDSWCLIARDGGAVICMRSEGGVRKITLKESGDVGQLFYLREPDRRRPIRRSKKQQNKPKLTSEQLERIHGGYERRLQPIMVDELARDLGVTVGGLVSLRIGSLRDGVFAFPMVDAERRMMGISFRALDGARWSETGGRNGLFVPAEMCHIDPLIVVEGPTDVAAMYGLGYDVIGRPSCKACDDLVGAYCKRRNVVILADDDDLDRSGRRPGYDGAVKLARSLRGVAASVKVVTPPGAKDARQWVQRGATRSLVDNVIGVAREFRG